VSANHGLKSVVSDNEHVMDFSPEPWSTIFAVNYFTAEIMPNIVILAGIIDTMVYQRSNFKNINPIQPSCKKAIYNSFEEAQEVIAHIKETRVVREISAYKCTICGFWHLTSRTK